MESHNDDQLQGNISSYERILSFPQSRNIQYLINTFIINKVDDEVASQVDKNKLSELGLAYGDIVMFQKFFNVSSQPSFPNYQERANELRKKLKRAHTGNSDCLKRPTSAPLSMKVTIGLKCLEKEKHKKSKKYTLKAHKSFTVELKKESSYEELHEIARSHFQIPVGTSTYLGPYRGGSLEKSFKNLGQYSLYSKERKKAVLLYLYYPKTLFKLTLKQLSANHDQSSSNSDISENEEAEILENSTNQINKTNSNEQENVSENKNNNEVTVTSSRERKICKKCGCTYLYFCLRCQQDEDYEIALAIDSSNNDFLYSQKNNVKDVSQCDTDSSPEKLHVNSMRSARLRYFNTAPLRYRHSIGSPSLSIAPIAKVGQSSCNSTFATNLSTASSSNEDPPSSNNSDLSASPFTKESQASSGNAYVFGDDEVKRFLDFQRRDTEQEKVDDAPSYDWLEVLKNMKDEFYSRVEGSKEKPIIIQRNTLRFWNLLFRQNIDFSTYQVRVRFAGESAADAGGPVREFLTLAMKNFCDAPNLFGDKLHCCFKATTDAILNKQFYLLGQLVGVSILTVGRGPACINEIILNELFQKEHKKPLPDIEHSVLKSNLECIEEKDLNCLYELDILPTENTDENKFLYTIKYVILNNFAAISHFKEGLQSIHESLCNPLYYNQIKMYLLANRAECSFDDFMKILNFRITVEKESNAYLKIQDAICEFEIFLASVSNGEQENLTLNDVLFFFTGFDTIPLLGMPKLIDVDFDESLTLPTISTCGLSVRLPTNDVKASLMIALKFGGGFGEV